MFKAHFDFTITSNHLTLTVRADGKRVELRPTRPFSFGDKLVGDRQALDEVARSAIRQVVRPSFFVLPIFHVEVPALVGDDEAALRETMIALGASKVFVTVAGSTTGR